MSASRYIHLAGVNILRETDKAFLIELDGEEYWIPMSQVADPEDYQEGDVDVELSITEWIAGEKGIA